MEMIERVAAALEAAFEREGRVLDAGQADDLARVAIEAMRDPDAEVAEAGNVIVRRSLFNSTSVWEAMIDAALKP